MITGAPARCQGRKADGTPCQAAPLHDHSHCYFHAPTMASHRKAAQRRGGQGNRAQVSDIQLPEFVPSNPGAILEMLADVVNCLRRGSINIKAAATLVYAADVMLRGQREFRIKQRVAALERLRDDAQPGGELFNPNALEEVE